MEYLFVDLQRWGCLAPNLFGLLGVWIFALFMVALFGGSKEE